MGFCALFRSDFCGVLFHVGGGDASATSTCPGRLTKVREVKREGGGEIERMKERWREGGRE